MLKLVAAVTFAASLAASAQMDMKPSGPQSTDKEKLQMLCGQDRPLLSKTRSLQTGQLILRLQTPNIESC
jgi:hypothetical protein